MAVYIYETIPKDPKQKPRRFEVQQSMKDAPLTKDPKTGEDTVTYQAKPQPQPSGNPNRE